MRYDYSSARAKVEQEGRCRGCGRSKAELARMGRTLEAAHTVGKTYDLPVTRGHKLVHRLAIIPLCGPATTTATCHAAFDGHELDLWDRLTPEERAWASSRVGEGQARRKIQGRQPLA